MVKNNSYMTNDEYDMNKELLKKVKKKKINNFIFHIYKYLHHFIEYYFVKTIIISLIKIFFLIQLF